MKKLLLIILSLTLLLTAVNVHASDISIQDVKFSTTGQPRMTTLSDGQIGVSVDVKNNTSAPKKGVLFMMLYSKADNSLISMSEGNFFDLTGSGNGTVTDSIMVTNSVNAELRVYMWDGFTAMRQYISPIFIQSANTPPTVPTGLASVGDYSDKVMLQWKASTDSLRVAGYKIKRDGTEIADITATEYTDTGLTEDISYTYSVCAYDDDGAESEYASITVKTAVAEITKEVLLGGVDFTNATALGSGNTVIDLLTYSGDFARVGNPSGIVQASPVIGDTSKCYYMAANGNRFRLGWDGVSKITDGSKLRVEFEFYAGTSYGGNLAVGAQTSGDFTNYAFAAGNNLKTDTWKTLSADITVTKKSAGGGIAVYGSGADVYIRKIKVYLVTE